MIASQNTLSLMPDFNLHRSGLTAVDSGTPDFLHGVPSNDYHQAVVDLSVASGSLTSVTFEALFWSDASQSFVSDSPAQTATLTKAGQFAIQTRGRRFFIKLTALTGTPTLVLNVAGTLNFL